MFEIIRSQPSKRVSWRVYKNGRYIQTFTRRKHAKLFIEWVQERGLEV